uniref:Fatty acid desaturase domain-containing protein n=1 Tax=Odontella aurita TaxID=265563 RepID=A0A6U6FV30_9STRA|mmetsp:Transcript_38164/g.114106  ORF Transcript_38164/g.114106 Transcript_38164/m.114106 type:complete len:372 (+) Transcript_38164:342-1457(+)|eukprot:CAMPEP_0113547480 /NCGR_PEP_ID=MMETSP0015_2-20120614/12379_1 /TAXON_ID=2838 /ORGANISM="Odontella" /LENGTH=371 /DNA_ID=CAMNT_0000448039 /DNA_START=286 /DNA_END=1401 /DNA_ORIENTATION=+ /assembly_acc=CAM_ASM_000160
MSKTQNEPARVASVPVSKVAQKTEGAASLSAAAKPLPWWRSGGMHVNMAGMGINTFLPVLYLGSCLPEEERKAFATFILAGYAAAAAVGCRTVYCILVVPTYMASLLLSLRTEGVDVEGGGDDEYRRHYYPAFLVATSVALAIVKVNICMSVCLHRYAAHAAFKCGPITHVAMSVLGCLANQGGPIWWASQHRCHHKYCDAPRDPHSPPLMGTEKAFAFFEIHQAVEEEFAPRHLESGWLRILDTWSWCAYFAEMVLAHAVLGRDGLFVAYSSGWISQSITLWFNVANHPPNADTGKVCKATDGKLPLHSYYLPFHILDMLYPLFGVFVAEGEHQHHHDHPGLAKRKPGDMAYWAFLAPLEMLGLVWDVNK